ncbi:unnamed protein product, partial [Didymodactylos carnosus]
LNNDLTYPLAALQVECGLLPFDLYLLYKGIKKAMSIKTRVF